MKRLLALSTVLLATACGGSAKAAAPTQPDPCAEPMATVAGILGSPDNAQRASVTGFSSADDPTAKGMYVIVQHTQCFSSIDVASAQAYIDALNSRLSRSSSGTGFWGNN